MTQTEAQLEENLITRLVGLGYARVTLKDSAAVIVNFKQQLQIHNHTTFSDAEFERILNHLDRGNVFDRAKTLREPMNLVRDNDERTYIEFLNVEEWCRNQYQVTHQVTQVGDYKNRYDVTLLINGLPLVQIELKRRGLEIKEAFNQIKRYEKHSFHAARGLFEYVQLYVISNGVNTKYYANQRKQSFKQTFFWAKKNNSTINALDDFTDAFLEKCHVSKMICRYIVLQESDKVLMVLRPYQYYAVEAIIDQVKNSRDGGYIWHTTGSGKTLTSFKAAQILTQLPKVKKVVFVVDRADLDTQTQREFNYFRKDCVDGTNNTRALVKQFADETPLIVTTIQKLNNAIHKERYSEHMAALKDERIVFIFDECHRSQFGDTHLRITQFFTRAQLFGFTGTPILEKNATRNDLGKRTTKDLFGECLHQYVITDAIRDQNVLKFAIEYWGKLKTKDGSLIDEQVAGIDTKEFFDNPDRINGIVDWVIQHHNRKTHNKTFSAMMAVSSVDALIAYYDTFKAKREAGLHDLRIATIFSFTANEEDKDADGVIGEPNFNVEAALNTNDKKGQHSREKLDAYIADYNAQYQTNFSTKTNDGFYNYYKDIGNRIKKRDKDNFDEKDRIDILLVVNMFLTGFDAKKINTFYVDKNLRYHGLVQAFSRTNRILNELKSQGNIVSFRNLKANTDEAILLFSNKNASETILVEPIEVYTERFNESVAMLLSIAPTPDDVSHLPSESEILQFVKTFRSMMRDMNVLKSFAEFSWADVDISEQTFRDYASKYHDIRDQVEKDKSVDKISIVGEVDFELELIHSDEINVAYILELLATLQKDEKDGADENTIKRRRQQIQDLLSSEIQLRSKRDLILQFIEEQMPKISASDNVTEVFAQFWDAQKHAAFESLCHDEILNIDKTQALLGRYDFTGKPPLRDDILAIMETQPKLMQRRQAVQRITEKLMAFVEQFSGVAEA